MADARITVRLSAAQDAKLTELAAATGTTKVQAMRRLIDASHGVAEQNVEALDIAGVRRLLSEQARRGSVPAARALLQHEYLWRRDRAVDQELEGLKEIAAG